MTAVTNNPGLGLTVLLVAALSGCGQPAVRQYTTQMFTQPSPADPAEPVERSQALGVLEAEILPEADHAHALERLRAGFQLPEARNPRLDRQIASYQRSAHSLHRNLEQAEPFLGWILDQIEARGLPAELALLPVIESGYQPLAYSSQHASGLWQFMPATGNHFGLKQTWWYDGRRDVAASTRAALDYLTYLRDTFNGDWLLALAAYNAGEGTVGRALRRNRARGEPEDYWHLDLPRETLAYVPKLLALRDIVATSGHYGIKLPELDAAPRIALVETAGQIDLGLAADLAGISVAEVQRLNPGLNRGATGPDGPHRLLIPIEATEHFAAHIAALPPDERARFKRHQIARGETLSGIAKRYQTSESLLRQANNLSGHLIRPGSSLLIPITRQPLATARIQALQQTQHQATANAPQVSTHQVRAGDSLWKIAQRNDLTVAQLARANGISANAPLRPGQRLVVSRAATARTAPSQPPGRQSLQYTVQRGDSLFVISRRYRVTVGDLRQWNNLAKNAYLQPGQQLTLFVDRAKLADGRDG
ncbi:MAG: LysM peptidoglycan-binding domain-containing protein [Gammaproteobacteria bacterium]